MKINEWVKQFATDHPFTALLWLVAIYIAYFCFGTLIFESYWGGVGFVVMAFIITFVK